MQLLALRIMLLLSLGFLACKRAPEPRIRLQSLVDSLFQAHPETRGLLAHVSAPSYQLTVWASPDSTSLSDETPFLIASITKLFTSAATFVWLDSAGLSLQTPIQNYLSAARDSQMRAAGYATNQITFGHLLSCTAGLSDYVETELFQQRSRNDPSYHWTRDEQINLALSQGKRAEPGELFAHGDINYLLLGELLEKYYAAPFYQVIRGLLQLDEHGLDRIYFNQLEKREGELKPVRQFAGSYMVDSYTQDPSFDLYGGGGIRCTMSDLARFTALLYQGELFSNKALSGKFMQDVWLNSGEVSPYGYGQMRWFTEKDTAYGHGGFWGTLVQYFPADSTCIAVSVLDRDAWKVNLKLIGRIRANLKQSN